MRYGFYLATRGPTATREGILALAREGERLGLDSVSENLGALGWEISNADMAEVDAILARHGAVTVPPGWLED
jgi:hypothetical protein